MMRRAILLFFATMILGAAGAGRADRFDRRPVVIEEFTGTWCGWCYYAGGALDAIKANDSSSNLILLAWHISDNYSIPECNGRQDYYGNSGWVPRVLFNGRNKTGVTDPSIEAFIDLYSQRIEDELTSMSGRTFFRMELQGRVGPTNPELSLMMTASAAYPNPLKAWFVVAEDAIPVTAPNDQRVLNGVVRAVLGVKDVTVTAAGRMTLTASKTGTIPCYSAQKLRPAVFLQDQTTGEIVAGIGQLVVNGVGHEWSLYQ